LTGNPLYFRENPVGNRGDAEQKPFLRGPADRLGVGAILFLITWKGRKSQKRKDDWLPLAEKFKVQGSKFKVMEAEDAPYDYGRCQI
jgi:hypothetical protein